MYIRRLVYFTALLVTAATMAHATSNADALQDAKQPCRLSGEIKDSDGRLITQGIVKLYTLNGSQFASGIDSKSGIYTFGAVPCGDSQIRVEGAGACPFVSKLTTKASASRYDVVLYPTAHPRLSSIITVVFCTLFLLTVIFFRWNNIAVVDQELLLADSAMTRLAVKVDVPDSNLRQAALLQAIDELESPFKKPKDGGRGRRLLDIVFWTRGAELGSWARLRDVQQQLAMCWDPVRDEERIRVRLVSLEQQLRTFDDPAARAIAEQVHAAIDGATLDPAKMQQVLGVALRAANTRREEAFTTLTTWQTKIGWLCLIGLAFVVVAAIARPELDMLLLAGGVGGLLSRLARALTSDDTPSDYGASWTTLFLSPIAGALAGYFGVLLTLGLTGLHILDQAIRDLIVTPMAACGSGDSNVTTSGLALALAFGFSERMFQRLVSQADGVFKTGATPVGPPSNPTPSKGRVAPPPSPPANQSSEKK